MGQKSKGGGLITAVCAMPHKTEASGNLVQATYGMMPEILRIEGQGNGGLTINFKTSTSETLMGKRGEVPSSNFLDTLRYEQNYGPVNIKVVDPLNLKSGEFVLKVVPEGWTIDNPISGTFGIDTCYWAVMRKDGQPLYMYKFSDQTKPDSAVYCIVSDRQLQYINEQIIPELGISISMTNCQPIANPIIPASNLTGGDVIPDAGDVTLLSSITFADKANGWLYGIPDADTDPDYNWIRAGRNIEAGSVNIGNPTLTDADYINQDYFYSNGQLTSILWKGFPIDDNKDFGNLIDGWSAYRLTSFNYLHPAFCEDMLKTSVEGYKSKPITGTASLVSADLNNLASVDIVFTNDTSKWSRCPVIALGYDYTQTEGGAKKFQLRRHFSVNKMGENDGTGTGMGWFPGYAVNIETGERLNIMFGENSMYGQANGRDMLWNPPYSLGLFGGMHYVYVLSSTPYKLYGYRNNDDYPTSFNNFKNVTPTRYDEGLWAYNLLVSLSAAEGKTGYNTLGDENEILITAGHKLFGSVMWVGCPIATCFKSGVGATDADKAQSNIPCDAKVSLRVRKPYANNWTSMGDISVSPQNDNRPMYQFSIGNDIATLANNSNTSESALDLIAVVPNPYYAYSSYELDRVQNLVKITNVPVNAYITIYTIDGTVVRKLRGPSSLTTLQTQIDGVLPYVEWDLKNHKGLPISGGTYLIHIKVDGVGEKLIKWFGSLRPVDLNSFPTN